MMKDVYILRIDEICPNCNNRNYIEQVTDFKIEIVACGYCGEYLLTPKDFDPTDKQLISDTINKAIEGDLDALL
jgi:hypothetical protein